jgi:hypothetical protein
LAAAPAAPVREPDFRKGGCGSQLHRQPYGPFAAMSYCEGALSDYLAVLYAAPIGAPVSDPPGRWSLEDRYWHEPLWGADITGFRWVSDAKTLIVVTSPIYGSGGTFRLDLYRRTAVQLLPKGRKVSLATPGPGYTLNQIRALLR